MEKEIARLRRDLHRLKQEQALLEMRLNRLSPPGDLDPADLANPENAAFALLNERQTKPQPKALEMQKIEDWVGLRGFSWLGIFALVMGLGLFVRFAYVEGWLGPWAVLFTGFVLSLGMLGLGEWLARKALYRTWAHALMGGGVALLYFLVYAAYHFSYFRNVTHLTEVTDCLLMMGVVGLAIFLALRRESQSLASRAFVLGFLTSFLSQDLETITLFYNLFLSLGLAWVAGRCRWGYLGLVGAVGSWVLHLLWLRANPHQPLLAFGTLLVLSAIFSLLGEYLGDDVGKNKAQDGSENDSPSDKPTFWASGIPILGFSLLGFAGLGVYLSNTVPTIWVVSGTLLWLGLQLALQFRRLNASPAQFSPAFEKIYLWPWGIAIALVDWRMTVANQGRFSALVLIGLAVAGLFWSRKCEKQAPQLADALWFWILSAAARAADQFCDAPVQALVWMALATATWFKRGAFPALRVSALLLSASTVTLLISQDFVQFYPHPGSLVLLNHLVLVLLLQVQVWQAIVQVGQKGQIGVGLLAAIGWMAWLHALLPEGWVSAVWVVVGCVLLGLGFALQQKSLRYQGIGILAISSLRVFLFDLQNLGLGFKILSLLGLGLGLLGMALVYTRFQKPSGSEATQTPTEASSDL